MSLKIAICDDEPKQIDSLTTLISYWRSINNYTCAIDTFPSAESFLFVYSEEQNWDILLLDIEMGSMNGVELAKKIRENNYSIQIIFITGYSDYISEGYEVSALHYLMKPVDREKLFRTLDRAYENSLRYMQYLTLKLPDSTVRVPFSEIRYLEVRQNYVTVHADREYTVKHPLREFENQLAPDDSFFRVGRSYIVNLRCIRQVIKKEILLLDGTIIPLPRGMYEPLNREIIRRL